ncbi:MAG: hypothetical protein KDB80_00475, partial [Planctomycetes bacterium]|nr:hypothetical protein [Planctomycetota bacterium]
VLGELVRIRSAGGSRLLRGLAVAVAMAGIGLSAAAFSSSTPRYVSVHPRSPVAFAAAPEATSVQSIRSTALDTLRFDYGGFDPGDLELVVSAQGRDFETTRLEPKVRGSEFVLSIEDSVFRGVVERIAAHSRVGPVDLVLQVPGAPPLGFASVRIDDDAPDVQLVVDGDVARSAALVGATRFRCEVNDAGDLAESSIVVRAASSEVRFPVTRSILDARSLLGATFPGFEDLGPVEIWAEASDAAGNLGRSEPLRFAHFDLRAPEIRSVPKVVTFDGGGASVRIVLQAEESGLAVAVRGPHGPVPVRSVRELGDRIDVVLGPTNREFPDGTYRLRLEDAWGNFSREYAEEWRFLASDPGLQVRIADGRAVKWREGIFSDGSEFGLSIECSELYRLRQVSVDESDGDAHVVPVEASGESRFRVDVPELPSGEYRLRLELGTIGVPDGETDVDPIQLVVRREPARVRIPAIGDSRFLDELVDAAILRRDADGTLSAADWAWDVEDRRMLTGRIWIGSEAVLTPREFVPPVTAQGPVVQRLPLKRGRNVLGLELFDVLGRRVEIWRGDREAPICGQVDDHEVREVAAFWYVEAPFGALAPEVLVEYGQPVDLALRCTLPLTARDPVQLVVGRSEFEPVTREGDRFEFRVPFEVVASA